MGYYALFAIFCVASSVYSANKNILSDAYYLMYVAIVLIACVCTTIEKIEDIYYVFDFYCASTILLFLILLITGNLISYGLFNELNRLGSTFTNNSNTFATFQLVAFCVSSWRFIYSKKENIKKRKRLLYLIATITSILSIALSGARKCLVSAIVCIFIYFFFKQDAGGQRKYVRNLLAFVIIFSLTMYVVLHNDYLYMIIGERFEELMLQFFGRSTAIEGSSSYLRAEYRKMAFQGWLNSPIWGHGFDSFRFFNNEVHGRNAYSHNNFLELLYNGGIIAFGLFYIIYYKITKMAIKSSVNETKALIIGSIVCILLFEYGQVDYNLSAILIYICLLYKFISFDKYGYSQMMNQQGRI